MARYAKHVSTRKTAQTEAASPKQRKNSAGGYSFVLDKWASLDRWLILGADGGTYYASESKLTKSNAKTIQACLAEDGARTVARIVEISDGGRAPKNDPAIFALAMAAGAGDPATRKAALDALPKVCRTGTHLFQFVDAVKNFRGWGRSLRRAVSKWYTTRKPDNLAYQVIKYPSRKLDRKDKNSVYSHRDVLRLAGGAIGPRSTETDAVLRYVVAGMDGLKGREFERRTGGPGTYPAIDQKHLPKIVHGWEAMKRAKTTKDAVKLIREYRLTHEMVLNQFKTKAEVWEALLPDMPATALIRNLATMTRAGLIAPFSDGAKMAVAKLADTEWLRKARVHPLTVFMALDTYERGKGKKGQSTWTPVAQVTDALEDAFYGAFPFVEPTGANHMLAVDCSGSMWGRGHHKYGRSMYGGFSNISGMDIPPRLGAALMAMVNVRTEANTLVTGFSYGGYGRNSRDGIQVVKVTKKSRINDAIAAFEKVPGGGTDCSLPMRYAMANKIPVDHFVVYTDNETYAGNIHPHQALVEYRQKMGRPAKLTVVGMTATNFTIADPDDSGMLDVVGFDTATPKIMADFAREGFGSA